jgi:hypothetical protein
LIYIDQKLQFEAVTDSDPYSNFELSLFQRAIQWVLSFSVLSRLAQFSELRTHCIRRLDTRLGIASN